MPKLTAKLVENLKDYGKYDDGDGLRLVIRKSGKAWVLRYQLAGKRKEIGLGPYPHYGLKEARSRADTHRALIREGIDPLTHKADALQQAEAARIAREMNLENTFRACAVDYIEAHRAGWNNAKHAQQWVNTLTTYAFPFIGEKPVDEVETDDILKILNPIWTSKPETAARVRNRLELVLDAAKARRLRTGENSARWRGHLDKLLPRRRLVDRGNHPALPWEQLPAFMAELEHSRDLSSTAVKLTVLCALRTSEVIGGYWEEVDLDEETWTIPASRMKAGRQHRVPLSKAALHTLRCLKAVSKSGLLFPGRSIGRPLSNMAMLQKIRGMDEKSLANNGPGWRNEAGEVITMHGFRSSFRDWAAETTNFANIVPEMALAHKISNATEAAYRRGDLLEKRKQLMEEWARYALSGCKAT